MLWADMGDIMSDDDDELMIAVDRTSLRAIFNPLGLTCTLEIAL
jgi:hypothetical protein